MSESGPDYITEVERRCQAARASTVPTSLCEGLALDDLPRVLIAFHSERARGDALAARCQALTAALEAIEATASLPGVPCPACAVIADDARRALGWRLHTHLEVVGGTDVAALRRAEPGATEGPPG